MISTLQRYHLVVTDERGEREMRLSVPGDALWVEVGAESADRLGLAPRSADSPRVFRLVNDSTGEQLMLDRTVAETLPRAGADYRLRLAP